MNKYPTPEQCLRFQRVALLSSVFFFSSLASASDIFNASQTICVNKNTQEQRGIELIYQSTDSPIPCSLHYDKAGVREEVASASNTKGHCEKIERKMVKNLVSSGWECQHSFLGEIGTQEKYDIALDMFSQEEDISATVPATTATEPDNEYKLRSAESIASDLKATLEEEYISDLQERMEKDFSDAMGPDFLVDVTVKLNLDINISPLTKNDNVMRELTFASDKEVPAIQAKNPDSTDTRTLTLNTELAHEKYSLSSQAFDNEQDAHRFAAEFHALYPRVQSRVAQFPNEQVWRLVLGMSNNQERFDSGIAQLDARTQPYFEVLETGMNPSDNNALVWIPDDWARYAVANCYAKGNTTSQEIADCANVVLDVDSFLSCLAGGICVPGRFSAQLTPKQIDFMAVVASEDPVAAARGILINDIQECENLSEPGSKDAAECAALSILDDDQRQMYECYQRIDEQLDLINCIGDETLSDNMMLYERCAVDRLTMSECVMAGVNNDYLNSAARCVNYGDPDAILSCAIDANIDVDQSRVLDCMTHSSSRSDQAQCLTHEYLDTEQTALLNCARGDMFESNMGLCIANQRGMLSGDEYRAAECLLAGQAEPKSLLDCAGARFASNELNHCLDTSIALTDCFTTETVISDVVAQNVDDLLDVDAFDNQIAMFRADLYALEGGDLADVLADDASAQIFATADEIVTDVKKKSGGLLKKLGF